MARSRAKKSADQIKAEKMKSQIAKRRFREAQSVEKREAAKAKNALAKKGMRADQSEEQRQAAKAKNAAAKKGMRADQSEEQRQAAKTKKAAANRVMRANQSEEQRQTAKAKNAAAKKGMRADQSEEQRQTAKTNNAAAMKRKRVSQKTSVEVKEALRTQDILNGSYHVKDLKDTADSIGYMDKVCAECSALKFNKETGTTCCNNGKVKLLFFPLPPDEINSLWYDQTSKGKLFRQNARHINNAVCISSIQVNERSRGFQPTVVFEGRVQHRVGPLKAEEGEIPRFVQLYVHNPSLETAQRFKNMYIPVNISHTHKQLAGVED